MEIEKIGGYSKKDHEYYKELDDIILLTKKKYNGGEYNENIQGDPDYNENDDNVASKNALSKSNKSSSSSSSFESDSQKNKKRKKN